jgi:hypothetical protein
MPGRLSLPLEAFPWEEYRGTNVAVGKEEYALRPSERFAMRGTRERPAGGHGLTVPFHGF